jgi:prepilin-type N-terminal cleavage/methylation domain-containing protein
MPRRQGVTLLEVVIVIAILAVLIALLLTAAQKVREAAARTQSMNNLRQIVLATHNYAADHGSQMPGYVENNGPSPFFTILPYIEQGNTYHQLMENPSVTSYFIKMYVSPADPSFAEVFSKQFHFSSYAANYQVFKGGPSLPTSMPDGASQTIAFAEHYASNCQGTYYDYMMRQYLGSLTHRATFADIGDIVPVTDGRPPLSHPQLGEWTFQVAPPLKLCNPMIAQTPHSGGMLAALCDGSVRILAPGMAVETYWASVTPNGGEIMGNDW